MTGPPDWFAAPVLSGRRVRLEPLGVEHAAGVAAAADEAVFEHLTVAAPATTDEGLALVRRFADDPGFVAWAQVDLGSGEVAGVTTYYLIDPACLTVTIGWTWLARRFWGSGLNTEAKLLLLRRAFDDLGCVRVGWQVDIRNTRSQAAVSRLGATREGVLRKHKRRRDGSWRDTVQFAMTDDDWPAVRDSLVARTTSGA